MRFYSIILVMVLMTVAMSKASNRDHRPRVKPFVWQVDVSHLTTNAGSGTSYVDRRE